MPGPRIAGGVSLLLAALTPAQAQQWLPAVPVTAERHPEAAIATMRPAADSVTPLLRRLPGVHVDRDGLNGAVSSLYLRGAEANHTAVYVDAVKVNDPTNTRGGSYDLSALPALDIARAELLAGPQSALLGGDALAGALNLVSATGREAPGVRTRLGWGSRGEQRQQASVGAAGERHDWLLGAAHSDSDERVPGGSARADAVHAGVGTAHWRASVRHHRADLSSFPDDSGGPRHAERRERERRRVAESLASLQARRDHGEHAALRATLGVYRRDEDADSPGVAPGARDPFGIPASRSDSRFQRLSLRLVGETRGARHRLAAGIEGEDERGDVDATLEGLGASDFERQRQRGALLLHGGYTPDEALWLEASARLEHTEQLPTQFLPRLRAVYDWRALQFSAAWGRGYKPPSFFALGHPLVGNPELQPERSRGAELGLALRRPRGELAMTVFDNRFRDAIDFEEGPPPRLLNRDEIRSRGLQTTLRLQPRPALALRLSATYADAELAGSDEPLRNRPRWTGSASLDWTLSPRWRLQFDETYVGRNVDSSSPTGERRLDAGWRSDVGVAYEPRPSLTLRAELLNAFDAHYEELVGFPGLARSARLSAEARF